MNDSHLSAIRQFEGFTARAKWDYAQNTNGYGTKAKFVGEVIDRTEAERRFQSEIADAEAQVEKFAPDLDSNTKAALTSLTFNAGTRWMSSGLGAAIRAGDLDAARQKLVQYNRAGGQVLAGLTARRLQEASWMPQSAQLASGPIANAPVASLAGAAMNNVVVIDSSHHEGKHPEKPIGEAQSLSRAVLNERRQQFDIATSPSSEPIQSLASPASDEQNATKVHYDLKGFLPDILALLRKMAAEPLAEIRVTSASYKDHNQIRRKNAASG